ncbi:MAG TPA: phosphoglycerate kinase [bacterium]|nr:phosphoglycerate kinase [bacterium]HPV65784.1 phosphoglycerate kinase [bacterium]
MKLQKLEKNKIKDKKVLLRCDFNVPIAGGKIKEDFKIRQSLETINFLLKNNCKIILLSHLGQPKNGFDKKFSLKPIASHLSKILAKNINFLSYDKYSKFVDIKKKINDELKKGQNIFLLDNIRFFDGEDRDCLRLGKSLSGLADVYVNDAFAVSHRANSSVSAVRKNIPSFAGMLLSKEIDSLEKIIKPKKPLVLIMGGAKIASKAPIIKKFYDKASFILLGGALANNFFKAQGFNIGQSLFDESSDKIVKTYLKSNKIILPIDVVVGSKNGKSKMIKQVKKLKEVADGDFIYDIGPETIGLFSRYIKKAKTIVWNGPMGKFEDSSFKKGTVMVASQIATHSRGSAFGVVGGGETVEALNLSGMASYVDWVSTGGGAMLDYLSGEEMPGIK